MRPRATRKRNARITGTKNSVFVFRGGCIDPMTRCVFHGVLHILFFFFPRGESVLYERQTDPLLVKSKNAPVFRCVHSSDLLECQKELLKHQVGIYLLCQTSYNFPKKTAKVAEKRQRN